MYVRAEFQIMEDNIFTFDYPDWFINNKLL